MITDLHRLLHTLCRAPSPASLPTRLAEVQRMRNALLACVQDCQGAPAQRLHGRIARAATPRELWDLRANTHDVIALHHCQAIAAQRIRTLDPLLEGSNL